MPFWLGGNKQVPRPDWVTYACTTCPFCAVATAGATCAGGWPTTPGIDVNWVLANRCQG